MLSVLNEIDLADGQLNPRTVTPAEPVPPPTFDETPADLSGGFPPILAILGLLVVGLFGTVISVLRGG